MSDKPKIEHGLPADFLALIEPARPFEICDQVRKLPSHPAPDRPLSPRATLSHANGLIGRLAQAWKESQERHAANESAIAHNRLMRARIEAIMDAAAMPKTVRRLKQTARRSWVPKYETVPAGYIGDLAVCYPVDDGYNSEWLDEQRKRTAYMEFQVKAQAAADEAQRAAEREQRAAIERRKADKRLGVILARYELGPEYDWPEVLESLRARSKYLDLAIAGIQTRGDWSDGFFRVKDAMGRFKIDSDQDKDIAADLMGCLSGEESDGRIFRDTRWSYDALLGLVDKQLAEDAQFALAQIPT